MRSGVGTMAVQYLPLFVEDMNLAHSLAVCLLQFVSTASGFKLDRDKEFKFFVSLAGDTD